MNTLFTRQILIAASLFFLAQSCHAATLSLGSVGDHAVGDVFSIPILVTTDSSQPLNTISTDIQFPSDKLRVLSLSDIGIIDAWAQKPSFSNSAGTVSFLGVTYNPGFSGSKGKVITLTFKVLAPGAASLHFASPSILANDGLATEILTSSSDATINLRSVAVESRKVTTAPVVKVATSSPAVPATSTAVVATKNEGPRTLFDVTAEPAVPVKVKQSPFEWATTDMLYALAVLIMVVVLVEGVFHLLWYLWHRMHRLRRLLIQQVNPKEAGLHPELYEINESLKEEIKHFMHVRIDRTLNPDEERALAYLAKLLEKTEQMLGSKEV